jgi:hypothetical protein
MQETEQIFVVEDESTHKLRPMLLIGRSVFEDTRRANAKRLTTRGTSSTTAPMAAYNVVH